MPPEEMTEKYPNQGLFIIDCEISENAELLSGIVVAHSESRNDIYEVSRHYNGTATIHFTGRMQAALKYQLEITDFKTAIWKPSLNSSMD